MPDETLTAKEFREQYRHDLPHPKRNKYGAKPTTRGNHRFDSQVEARYWDHLQMLKEAGEITMILRQVPLHCDSGNILRIDFVVFWADGRVEFLDVKGRITRDFKTKRREVESEKPIRIRVVKSEDFE